MDLVELTKLIFGGNLPCTNSIINVSPISSLVCCNRGKFSRCFGHFLVILPRDGEGWVEGEKGAGGMMFHDMGGAQCTLFTGNADKRRAGGCPAAT